MAILDVVRYPDERLSKVSEQVTAFDAELQSFCESLVETMIARDGIGLAAIQVGVPKHMFAVNLPEGPRVFINTKFTYKSIKTESDFEGCLSLPGINAKVERPIAIELTAQAVNGQEFSLKADGLLARVLQHEFDHCEGILYIDRLIHLKRQMVLKKFNKIWK